MAITAELGTGDGVRRLIGRTSDELTDSEVDEYLKEATNEITARTYKHFMLDRYVATLKDEDGNIVKNYETYFELDSSATSHIKVYLNGDLKTLTTDYTINSSDSTIEFTSSVDVNSGDNVDIFYKPNFFDDLANVMAALYLAETSTVDTSEGQGTSPITERLQRRHDLYWKMILNKPTVHGAPDHAENYGIF